MARGQSAVTRGQVLFCVPKENQKWFSRLCAGLERFFIKANCSLLMSKENQKTTSDFDALDPRERGCSPLSDPKEEVETEKS